MGPKYNPTELLATVASKALEDKKSVFVGTGLPILSGFSPRGHLLPIF
jgi:acyl CoA:acetate/3-ketoacid CoA transferase beta subunit